MRTSACRHTTFCPFWCVLKQKLNTCSWKGFQLYLYRLGLVDTWKHLDFSYKPVSSDFHVWVAESSLFGGILQAIALHCTEDLEQRLLKKNFSVKQESTSFWYGKGTKPLLSSVPFSAWRWWSWHWNNPPGLAQQVKLNPDNYKRR